MAKPVIPGTAKAKKAPAPKVKAATVSFANDIRPKFTPGDIACMKGQGLDLTSYPQVKAKSSLVQYKISHNQMPPGNPWSAAWKAVLNNWIAGGCQP